MKKIFTLLVLFLACGFLYAGSLRLAWDPSPSLNVTGYTLYATTNAPGSVTNDVPVATVVGNHLTVLLDQLKPGKYYFWVTATTTEGQESSPSNFVMVEAPKPPENVHTVIVQMSDEITFSNLVNTAFFRLRLQ